MTGGGLIICACSKSVFLRDLIFEASECRIPLDVCAGRKNIDQPSDHSTIGISTCQRINSKNRKNGWFRLTIKSIKRHPLLGLSALGGGKIERDRNNRHNRKKTENSGHRRSACPTQVLVLEESSEKVLCYADLPKLLHRSKSFVGAFLANRVGSELRRG